MGSWVPFVGVKEMEREADLLPSYRAKSRISVAIPPFPSLYLVLNKSQGQITFHLLGCTAGGEFDRVDSQRPAHGTNLHVRKYRGSRTGGYVVQHPVARGRTYQRADRVHSLLLYPGVCYSPSAHFRVLLSRHSQTENSGAQEQIEREEKVPQESHQIGSHSHCCIRTVLASVLDHSGW